MKEAFDEGCILSGLSAGANCWFENSHSDSQKNEVEPGQPWEYIKVRGLGYIRAFVCPHFDAEKDRQKNFENMLDDNEVGIGLENNTAIYFDDGDIEIIKSNVNAKVYKIVKNEGKIVYSEINKLKL